eukprot:gene8322-2848_t
MSQGEADQMAEINKKYERVRQIGKGSHGCCHLARSKSGSYYVVKEVDLKGLNKKDREQVMNLIGSLRPDRQTCMFSATFGHKVENLARKTLTNPIRCEFGGTGKANSDVKQVVTLLPTDAEKWDRLIEILVAEASRGMVLIFVNFKDAADALAENLEGSGYL